MVGTLERAQEILDADPDLAHDARLDAGPRVPDLNVWLGHGYRWLERPRDANAALARTTTAELDRRNIHFRDSTRAGVAFASGRLLEAGRRAERALERATQLGMHDDVTSPRGPAGDRRADVRARRPAPRRRAMLEELTEPPGRIRRPACSPSPRRSNSRMCSGPNATCRRARDSCSGYASSTTKRDGLRRRHHAHAGPPSCCLLAIGRIDAARITLGPPPYSDAPSRSLPRSSS